MKADETAVQIPLHCHGITRYIVEHFEGPRVNSFSFKENTKINEGAWVA